MSSPYDTIADSCDALAAKAEHKSAKARLQRLAVQWRSVAADKAKRPIDRGRWATPEANFLVLRLLAPRTLVCRNSHRIYRPWPGKDRSDVLPAL
jgi:hypothetical protein